MYEIKKYETEVSKTAPVGLHQQQILFVYFTV